MNNNELTKYYGLNVDITEQQYTTLDMLAKFVELKSKDINITAIRDYDSIIEKHIVDSLQIYNTYYKTAINNSKNLLDIGTGGGFPGLVLAIMQQDVKFTLLDSTKKKLNVIDEFVKKGKIENVQTIWARVESEDFRSKYPSYFNIITARAVSDIDKLMNYAFPVLLNGGHLFLYKQFDQHKENLERINANSNFILKDTYTYTIDSNKRIIYCLEKKL